MAKKVAKKKKPVGRPRKYESPEEMQKAIDKYFAEEENLTVCGLCLALGFNDRSSLIDYGGYSKEFFHTIKKAKFRIENFLEKRLAGTKPTGTIFNLKNNFGWRDAHDFEHTGKDGEPIAVQIVNYAGAAKK